MALIKACTTSTSIKNTGKECDTAMGATAMLIAVAPSLKWTMADMVDPYAYFNTQIHARKAFPLFGQKAPIRTITNNTEADILVTLDDGLQAFLRYGIYNRILETTSGGLCYAQALQSLNASGYNLVEIDQSGNVMMRKNQDGTYSGLIIDFMYAPSPVIADFKNTMYKNRFQYSLSPVELVNNGVILSGGQELLSMMGLIDVEYTEAAVATTTTLTVGVFTECAEADLVDLFGADLAEVGNFVIKNKLTGVEVIPSAVAIVGGALEFTGVFVSGQTYVVTGSTPAVWKAADIEGYDGSAGSVDILVP